MLSRCYKSSDAWYRHYGGRGIKVCDRWLHSFENFLADMGPRPSPKHSIDRRDNDGNYEPGNCRWATAKEQNRNQRGNRVVIIENRSLTLAELSELSGISSSTLSHRLNLGLSPEEAISFRPLQPKERLAHFGGRRKTSRLILAFGETKTLAQWARERGIPGDTLAFRIDNAGESPEEALSRPSHHRMFTAAGSTKRLADWAKELGISPGTILDRIKYGWSIEDALTTPRLSGRRSGRQTAH